MTHADLLAQTPEGSRTFIRGGLIVDGSGAPAFTGDVEIEGSSIAAVGKVGSGPGQEIDARGMLVTPGFIDVHTHYDGQVTWSHSITPSSMHGVTTAVIGNCGVGFAPCRPADRDRLLRLMEGVEDIPGVVLDEGVPWAWETFPDYLNFLGSRNYDIDLAAYVPHAAVRVYAMGARGAAREPATAADCAAMRRIVAEGVRAGAIGVSTSRSYNHKGSDGSATPTYQAGLPELMSLAKGLQDAGAGLLQLVTEFDDPLQDFEDFRKLARATGRPITVLLLQQHTRPERWRQVLGLLEESRSENIEITGQVCGRAIGMLMGLDLGMNPFSYHPSYAAIADLPLAQRCALLATPEMRRKILSERPVDPTGLHERQMERATDLDGVYVLGDPPNYEPRPEDSIAATARRTGFTPNEFAYDQMLMDDGRAVFVRPLFNYAFGDLAESREMLVHPATVLGLGDGGAHCGYICDASLPTFMIAHWTRDRSRGERIPLPEVIRSLSFKGAQLVGLRDRGLLAAGMKADLNIIDYQRMRLHRPNAVYDLPAHGRRLMQQADGYVMTMVSGIITRQDGRSTKEFPGRLVRRR